MIEDPPLLTRGNATVTNQPKDVVVFDGACRFCQQQISRIKRWDTRNCFEYVPRQTPDLEDRFPQLKEGDFNTGMRLIAVSGKVYVGADAVYQITRHLPRWRWISWLYLVPGIHGLSRWMYARIAARRLQLGKSCDNQACEI